MSATVLKFQSLKDMAEFSRTIQSANFIMVVQQLKLKAEVTKDEVMAAQMHYQAIVEELEPMRN